MRKRVNNEIKHSYQRSGIKEENGKNMRVKNKIKHRNPELLRKEQDKTSILAALR